jgi:hypothetical protein
VAPFGAHFDGAEPIDNDFPEVVARGKLLAKVRGDR